MIPYIAFGLAALTSEGDVDKNVAKRQSHVLLHSYPPAIDLSNPTYELRRNAAFCYRTLKCLKKPTFGVRYVLFCLFYRGVFVGPRYITHFRFDFQVRVR